MRNKCTAEIVRLARPAGTRRGAKNGFPILAAFSMTNPQDRTESVPLKPIAEARAPFGSLTKVSRAGNYRNKSVDTD
jgi:hypothetical protein